MTTNRERAGGMLYIYHGPMCARYDKVPGPCSCASLGRVEEIAKALDAAEQRGALAERARVVAFLRSDEAESFVAGWLAQLIEKGRHYDGT